MTESKPPPGSVAEQRAAFNGKRAPEIATLLGLPPMITGGGLSKRFAFFADDERLAVVAGRQEGDDVELALAYAVRHAKRRRTALVLPAGHTNATAQRIPWLLPKLRPELYVHDAHTVEPVRPRSIAETVQALVDRLEGATPAHELAAATTPLHIADEPSGVGELVEQLTRDPRLDHAHRKGERAWHYAGLRVLSIRTAHGAIRMTAGVHYSGAAAPTPLVVPRDGELPDAARAAVLDAVEAAIDERRSGPPPIHRPDEHWLQAIIRRDPSLLGIEQPALRELPAWRPRDSPSSWGRGFIDLIGLDGHGRIRIVETKLATNADDLLILQGLDYFVWAQAYGDAIRDRLGAPKQAPFELHYVLGASAHDQTLKLSPCTAPLAAAINPALVRWRSQTVRNWWIAPESAERPVVQHFPQLPTHQAP